MIISKHDQAIVEVYKEFRLDMYTQAPRDNDGFCIIEDTAGDLEDPGFWDEMIQAIERSL